MATVTNLKVKTAKLLRSWADKLSPYYKSNYDMDVPQLKTSQRDMQKISVQIKYSAYMYMQYGERINKYVKDEMADKIAEAIKDRDLIAITSNQDSREIIYTGKIGIVDLHQ